MEKFQLGQVVATPGVLEEVERDEIFEMVRRHSTGDWGDLCEEDRAANEEALIEGGRLLSAYTDSKGTKVWVITEADRSSTTVLLPDEY